MKKYILFIVIILLSSINLEAKLLKFNLDGAMFKSDDNNVRWEMYYSFPDTMLNFIKSGINYTGELYISVKIKTPVNIEAQNEWIVTYSKDITKKSPPMDLVGQKPFLLSPGQYTVELNIKDVNDSSSHAHSQFEMFVRGFPDNKVGISNLELAQTIENSTSATFQWNQAFYKNQLYVVPNPSMFYIGTNPVLPIYLEIYNAQKVSPGGILLEYKIYDAVKRDVITIPKRIQPLNDGFVETDQIPVDILPTGTYFLQAIISYPLDTPLDTISTMKKFYINNPEIPPDLNLAFSENASFEKSEFSTLTSEQVEKEFLKAQIIATNDEIELFDKLTTVEAKQKFLYRFWLERDPDSTTVVNERLLQYRELINYADINFKYGRMKDGWRTDRGKVLLKYGQPDQREQHAADKELRAYESWFYPNYQGGVYFYFVDMQGFGNFRQVSSTAFGEMNNENWYQQYVPAHGSQDFSNPNTNPDNIIR